ncbi:hypothetical protein [Streptomyces decoyicus]|uniref:hypothetical protein n=1 Tax=Streptomyces decoyicus TaxID=249567 RepID=UPI0004AB1BC4|nr:hypothetical protein [Streptomyces decoyicus]KOG37592.1 hypothetical protein ADK74_36060 [Streptomyces decoyicus]QZY14786.1 hypothetical protein K7C20_05605 [Streptomyces decoyicus]
MTGGGPLAGHGLLHGALAQGGSGGEGSEGSGGSGGGEGAGLLHHLLVDAALKGAIVIAALIVLALGMVLIWKKAGRCGAPPATGGDPRRAVPRPHDGR